LPRVSTAHSGLLYGTEMRSALLPVWCFVLPEEALRTRIGTDIARMPIEDHDPLDRLQEAARRYRGTRTGTRVRAILLAKQGDTAPGTPRALGFSRRAVRAWVAASNRAAWTRCRTGPTPAGRRPCRMRRRPASWSGSMRPRTPRTGSASCAGLTSGGSRTRRSAPGTASAACTVQAAPPARLQRPDAPAAAPRRQPRGPGALKQVVV